MTIYTDGSCRANGKDNSLGGFGIVVLDDAGNLLSCYQKLNAEGTTNNREEMKAILYALITYGNQFETPLVFSDSRYAVNTFTNWMYGWQRNGWIKSDKKIPENLDLVQAFYDLEQNRGYNIDLRYVKGHAGHTWNEIADRLATGTITTEEVMKRYGKNN
jgi:ribonuclease HI